MPNKLHTPSSGNKPIKNVREGGYQKLLAKQGLNAPIFQQTKAWLKQYKEIANSKGSPLIVYMNPMWYQKRKNKTLRVYAKKTIRLFQM